MIKQRFLTFLLCLLLPAMAMGGNGKKDKPEGVPFNGLVTDLTGTPLRNVRVFLHAESYSARTDKKGRFGLTNVQSTDTIHLRYGKTDYAIPVEGRKSIRIRLGDQLTPEAAEDQEMVDIGYGWVKRRESLQSSSGIRGEDLIRGGYTNILEALRGRIPGLNVSASGRPGEEAHVSMRGINSLHLDQTPLFVVDGMVVQSLDYINLYDVDYVEILREASIYGSRGANGAILVHTKHGK